MTHSITVEGYTPPTKKIIEVIREELGSDYSISVERPDSSNKTADILVMDAGWNSEGPTLRQWGYTISVLWNEETSLRNCETLMQVIELAVLSLTASISSGVRYAEASEVTYGKQPGAPIPFATQRFDLLISPSKTIRLKIKQ